MQKQYIKILFVFLLTLNSFFVKAQWVTIPDANFRTWLNNNGFASCMSGNSLNTTCNLVLTTHKINCYNSNIHTLWGIQYFVNLDTLKCSENFISSLSNFPPSLTYLECYGSHIDTLTNLPALTYLDCSGNPFTSLPNLPISLTTLSCGQSNLSTLANLPPSLMSLDCSNMWVALTLPSLPPSLQKLICNVDSLTSLPTLPNSINHLECWLNQLTSLPTLPTSLTYLFCGTNQLSSLPSLPSSLTDLNCWENPLITLPPLPTNLNSLCCISDQLTSLPSLPSTLWYLNCNNNQLSSLPGLPQLQELDCNHNLLSTLPTLPITLQRLDISYNLFTIFPSLQWLMNLNCSHNQLTSIPGNIIEFNLNCSYNQLTSLFTNAYSIACNHNQLTTLSQLSDSVSYLDISNNPGLSCFPKFKKIVNLIWDSTGISCLPNIGYIGTANPPAPPLCQPASGCDFYWNMYGNIFKDDNSNCTKDSNELVIKNIPMKLDSGGNQLQIFITNSEGYYSFETGLGNYQIKIDTTGLPFDVMCPASGSYLSSLTAIDSLDADLDFGLQCKTGYLDLIAKSISPSSTLRPAAQRTLYLNAGDATLFYGVTCSAGVSGSVEAILIGPVSYMAPAIGALTPTAINGDTVLWSVNDFSLINPTADFNIIIQVDSSATVNDTVCVQLNISSAATDNIPSNNSVSNCFPVVNSFDPNAKEIYPAGFVDTTAHDFTFTIYFQNTGNAVAENVYILDTLDNDLKLNTFQFLSSNHDVITQLLPGRVLRFSFPHINLPDSVSNEPASHGYVQFKISRKNILYPDMIILNHAQIFFDLNPPVTTNDACAVFNFNCNDLLSVSITDTAICENEIFTASNNISFTFPVSYQWMIDTTNVSTTSSVSVTGLSAGVHQLILNVSAGYCTVSHTQQITVYSLPIAPGINISGDTLSTNTGFSYQWFLNNNSINGAVQNNYLISQSGWYSVMITDSNGCSALSDSVFVSPVGIEEASAALSLTVKVYPNPAKDILFIQTISKPNETLNIELCDITGRKLQTIFNGKTSSAFSKYSLSLKSFSKGVYILKVNNLVKRILVQ